MLSPSFAYAYSSGRYLYEGDGVLSLICDKTKEEVQVRYRHPFGHYDSQAIREINRVFNVGQGGPGDNVSLRLIAFLDYLQDRFAPGKPLTLLSGFRTTDENNALRRQGLPAAKASYHLEGMAADVVFPDVGARSVWNFVKSLRYGGAGYYGGTSVHIDTGKPRFWPGGGNPDDDDAAIANRENKNVYLTTDQDFYYRGETARFILSGINTYRFGISPVVELVTGNEVIPLRAHVPSWDYSPCSPIRSRRDAHFIGLSIPDMAMIPSGSYQIRMRFCDRDGFPAMPEAILSRPFLIKQGMKVAKVDGYEPLRMRDHRTKKKSFRRHRGL